MSSVTRVHSWVSDLTRGNHSISTSLGAENYKLLLRVVTIIVYFALQLRVATVIVRFADKIIRNEWCPDETLADVERDALAILGVAPVPAEPFKKSAAQQYTSREWNVSEKSGTFVNLSNSGCQRF